MSIFHDWVSFSTHIHYGGYMSAGQSGICHVTLTSFSRSTNFVKFTSNFRI